jgi:hypothetical protein
MKSIDLVMNELESRLSKDINKLILELIGVKFENSIIEIVKLRTSTIIYDHLKNTSLLNEMKSNLEGFIKTYCSNLEEQKGLLNIRMDHIEQQLLNLIQIMERSHLLIQLNKNKPVP